MSDDTNNDDGKDMRYKIRNEVLRGGRVPLLEMDTSDAPDTPELPNLKVTQRQRLQPRDQVPP